MSHDPFATHPDSAPSPTPGAGGSPNASNFATHPELANVPSANATGTIGRYRVLRVLGEGSFGRVYLAHDDELNRDVAIKVPLAERISRPQDVDAFLAEARTLAILQHPNIVAIFDAGRTADGSCFVVSAYVAGTDLAQRLKTSRPTFAEAAGLIATVADALHYAHRHGLVHRDVKPANILIDADGVPVLADFGLVLRDAEFGRTGGFAGTPAYMSPEQANGEGHRVDGRSDIFSLGIVFYELLTGHRPFHADTQAELLDQIASIDARPPRQVDDAIPKELERICLKALAKRATDRYTVAKDLAEDLRSFLERPPYGPSPVAPGDLKGSVDDADSPLTQGAADKLAFLSYASADKYAAFHLCRCLEDQGIGCWIAPRDVPPGANYGEAIIRAIESTTTTVLLLSAHSNASVHVHHEVERATSKRKRVIPVRLTEISPAPSLELHLSTVQWVNAWDMTVERLAEQLAPALRGEWHASPKPVSVESRPIKIVPKGLRSFDAGDADFFLELLPGPRDRDGMPESLRFWKSRIEENDAAATFTVGLLYGPSGSGKSSLVKAGLLPRLTADVVPILIEATADDTESRLLSALRRRCPDLDPTLSLKASLAEVRRGGGLPAGKKLVLVVDQFEQWLHAKKDQENTDLVHALRQCDGERVQALVLVRDDFWMAATRFLRELEVRLVEGQNSAAVDLFPIRHAQKVLAAFGRALGCLPERPGDASVENTRFLEQAIAGLSQDGKVISVRLALFAEMMKGRPWTPAALRDVGGAEGVGTTFLEETFSAPSAPPGHRLHQKAIRAVLHALLPNSGSDIKGHMRSRAELLDASGYALRPRDFDDVLRILDTELRLLTPTDSEGKNVGDTTDPSATGSRFFQLTHDYLVPSLREWLTRKQKETRRGRAELALADRAADWAARPEPRRLPTLGQWLGIVLLTRKRSWTPQQQAMMRAATRLHLTRGAIVGVLLVVATVAGLSIRDQLVRERNATQAARNDAYADGLVQRLLGSDTDQAPKTIAEMADYRTWTDQRLRDALVASAPNSPQKLRAALALLPVDPGQVEFLSTRLLDVEPDEIDVVRTALDEHKGPLISKLWAVVDSPEPGKTSRRLRAAAALAKFDPANPKWTSAAAAIVDDLVAQNPVFLGWWSKALAPVKSRLIPRLAVHFRNPLPEHAAERTLATNLLAEYAIDQPSVLADLLMDADERQFARIFPLVEALSGRCVPDLTRELDKLPADGKDLTIFESFDKEISPDDPPLKDMKAKHFDVSLQAGKKYRITMSSGAFDSVLVVYDRSGKELGYDDDGGEKKLDALLDLTVPADDVYTIYAAAFQGTGAFELRVVEVIRPDAPREALAKRQANAATALMKLNRPERAWTLFEHGSDPRVRSYLIHRLASLGVDPAPILARFDQTGNVSSRRALLLALGDYEEAAVPAETRASLLPKLQDAFRDDDPGLRAAAEWLLRTWKHDDWLKSTDEAAANDALGRERRLESIRAAIAKTKEKTPPQWYVTSQGQTMTVLAGPILFRMGSPPTEADRGENETPHDRRIGRSYALATKAVTMEQYRQFDKDFEIEAKYHRVANLPVVKVDWFQAASYCNWLSERDGIPKEQWCYETEPKGETGPQVKVIGLKPDYLKRTGYRLPTEAEFEYAARAGSITSRFFGETDDLLPKYAWYVRNSQDRTWPVGTRKPNDFGFFDIQGNAFTWCQESYKKTPGSPATADDVEDIPTIDTDRGRVLRGGSYSDQAADLRSADRYYDGPTYRFGYVGFRPARTIRP